MFRDDERFFSPHGEGQRRTDNGAGGVWWLMTIPGVGLICVALAIVVWPELLAYMVASLFFCAGLALVVLGGRMRHVEQRWRWYLRYPQQRRGYDQDDWQR